MVIGVLKEEAPDTRVSLLPEAVEQLVRMGNEVLVETDAGAASFAGNDQYVGAGARVQTREETVAKADLILSINDPAQRISVKPSSVMLGIYHPLLRPRAVQNWIASGATVLSMDMLPRTTRAQSMDVLSSQASIAGYKAVLQAAALYPRYFPMLITAAGSIPPAKVLVIGAGVAGLQAVATARRLGAVVEVFDTRPAVKEEVMSLGAKFIEVEGAADASNAGGYAVEQSDAYKQKQTARIAESIAKADIVVTTAQIPGKKAPLLITAPMVHSMRAGSVIMDLAAATGGNTPFTEDNKTVVQHDVFIVGAGNLAASLAFDASKLYGRNILNFIKLLIREDKLQLDFSDELVAQTCVTHDGRVMNARVKSILDEI